MIPELCDKQGILLDLIHEAMFLVYSPGPIAGQGMFKRLGFSLPFVGRSRDVPDQIVDPVQNTLVSFLPMEVFIPGLRGKNDFHSSRSISVPLPSSNSLIDSRSLRALRGLLRR